MAQRADSVSVVELGRHVERTTRRTSGCRGDCAVVGLARGWCRLQPGDEGELASGGKTRVYWLGVDSPLARTDVEEMGAAVRAAGATGAFVWVSPLGCAGGGDEELVRAGAVREAYVRYVSLVRRAGAHGAEHGLTPSRQSVARTTALTVRRIEASDVRRSMESVKAGGTQAGIAAAEVIVGNGWAEMYGAFDATVDGETCAATAAILKDPVDPSWAYLGWAGTDPAYRGRGAQTALIAARVARARQLGATWCVSETNTAAEGSLRNLLRAGFEVGVEWGVFRWRDGVKTVRR